MNLVSTPDGRIINLDHLTYAERTGEYVILHFTGAGTDGGSGFGRISPKNAPRRSRRFSPASILRKPYYEPRRARIPDRAVGIEAI